MSRLSLTAIAAAVLAVFAQPTMAHAINCSKATSTIDRMICSDTQLRSADAALNAAYSKTLKAAGDEQIRTMLVASQKRWLGQRDEQLGHLDEYGDDAPDAETWREIVLKAINERTSDLARSSDVDPKLPQLVAAAQEQRRVAARFTGGPFAGFNTSCDFLPTGGGSSYSYGCFGQRRFQNRDKVCTVAQDWASGSVSDTRSEGKVVNGKLRTVEADDDEEAPAAPLPALDAEADFEIDTQWLSACLTGNDVPADGAAAVNENIAPSRAGNPSTTATSSEADRFSAFFAAFREAVLAGDRDTVTGMTQFPFVDFRAGYYCEPDDKTCTVSPDTLTSRNRAAFLKNYDKIFTPAVIAEIRADHFRGFRPGEDDGEMPGPIVPGEYLLDSPDIDLQRVFVPVGDTWKLARVPFYS